MSGLLPHPQRFVSGHDPSAPELQRIPTLKEPIPRRPLGHQFKKGEQHQFRYRPGQAGNPGGKPKIHQTLSTEYARWLARPAPAEVSGALGLPNQKYSRRRYSRLHV